MIVQAENNVAHLPDKVFVCKASVQLRIDSASHELLPNVDPCVNPPLTECIGSNCLQEIIPYENIAEQPRAIAAI